MYFDSTLAFKSLPCVRTVSDAPMHIISVQDLEYILLQPTCSSEKGHMQEEDSVSIRKGLALAEK
jgi:hypothetical protein